MNYVREYEEAGLPYPKMEKGIRHTSVFTFNERLITYMRSKCPKGKRIDFVRIIDSNLREYVSCRGANLPQSKRVIAVNRIENIYQNMLSEIRRGTEIQESHLTINCPSSSHWYNFETNMGFNRIFHNGILKTRRFVILIGKRKEDGQNIYAICQVSNAGWYDILNWEKVCVAKPEIFLIEVFPNQEIPYTEPIDSPNEDFYNTIHLREEFLSKFCYVYVAAKQTLNSLKSLLGVAMVDLEPIAVPREILNPDQMILSHQHKLEEWHSQPIPLDFDWNTAMQFHPMEQIFYTTKNSYEDVLSFIDHVVMNPETVEIDITLYRTAFRSKIVNDLILAARNGIKVKVYIELTARGDEMHNLKVYQMLRAEKNIEVRSGVLNHKVHAKMMIVEMKGNRFIGLVSTGNFNEDTAKIYKDFVYITSDEKTIVDLSREFGLIFERRDPFYNKKVDELIASKRNTIYRNIEKMTESAKRGNHPNIIFKCNHLVDPTTIRLLTEAAEAGVKVTCIVRTTIGLKSNPDIGLSVYSAVGQFLEHDRVYIFSDEELSVYLSSADLMYRNLYNRIESLVKIQSKPIAMDILYRVLESISTTAKNVFVDEIDPNYTLDIFQ